MSDTTSAASSDDDALTQLRGELERIDELSVADRVERFEHVNEVIAAELGDLDEL